MGNAINAAESLQNGDLVGAALNGAGALLAVRQFGRTCFAAGTPLLTPDGARPIEELCVGDLVLSRDEDDPEGPVAAKRVLNVFENYSPLLDLHVGGRAIRTTAEHPFWVVGLGWVAAQQIQAGDMLLGADGAQTVVEEIEGPTEPAPVYNVEVEDYHTYLVGRLSGGSRSGAQCGLPGAAGEAKK